MSPTATIAVGKFAFVSCVTDNSNTVDGMSIDRHTVTDSQGNEWFRFVTEFTETDGSADDGVCISQWWSKITTAITTSDTITLTTAVPQRDSIISCFEATFGAGKTVGAANYGIGQGTLNTSISGLTSREYMFIYIAGSEGEDAAKTPATNYIERFDLISSTSGALDANICLHVATRVQTTTSTGTVASSGWTGTNFMALLIAVYEIDDIVHYTMPADAGTFSITGQDSNLLHNKLIVAGDGAFAITGESANLLKGYKLTAQEGTFLITGEDATLTHVVSLGLTADPGSFVITGYDTGLIKHHKLSLDAGSLVITGQEVSFGRNYRLMTDQGPFLITGHDVLFIKNSLLNAESGSFAITGQNAALQYNKHLVAGSGAFAITGYDADLRLDIPLLLDAESGSFVLTGQEVNLILKRRIVPEAGVFTITGYDATLSHVEVKKLTAQAGAFRITGYSAVLRKSTDSMVSKPRRKFIPSADFFHH